MCALNIDTDSILQNGKFALFHKVGEDSFFINSVAIMSPNQIITKNFCYDLIDLLDGGAIKLTDFIFKNAVLRGFDFFVIGIDVKTGEVIHRQHRLDFGELSCDWFLIESDYLVKDNKSEVFHDNYHENAKRKSDI
jgi:hypothetical protein